MISPRGSRSRSPARPPPAAAPSSAAARRGEEDWTSDSSFDCDVLDARALSGSGDCGEFASVVESRRLAELEEETRWKFAAMQSSVAEDRAAWDRSRARRDAKRAQALIIRSSAGASAAEQRAARRERGHMQTALASARSCYKARTTAFAVTARAAMDVAEGDSIPPPVATAEIASAALAAHAEEQLYLENAVARQNARFAELQADFAVERADWQRRAKIQDEQTVRDCIARVRPPAQGDSQRQVCLLTFALARVRDAYGTREENVASQGRQAMRSASTRAAR